MNMVYTSIYLYHLQFLSSVCCNFPSTGLSPPWLNLFLGILSFFFFWCNRKWNVFSFSLSDSPLLMHKNATSFWIYILYPATLLISFISSSSFFVESVGFSTYSIMSSTNDSSFTSSFPISFSSSCLIAMARTSTTMLNKSDESGQRCLVPDPSHTHPGPAEAATNWIAL